MNAIVVIVSLFINSTLLAQSQVHSTSIDQESGAGNTFYNNHQYFQCMSRKHCVGDSSGQEYVVFIKDIHSKKVIPSFIQCQDSGEATVAMAESLIPHFNPEDGQIVACFNPDDAGPDVSPDFVGRTMRALDAYQGECPKDDRSCGQQVADLFMQDVKNMISLTKKKVSDETTKMGCLSTLLTNLKDSLYSTLKLFLWDAPKKIFEIGKNTWNYFFGKEKETSTSMLLSSVMSKEMAEALSDWDLAKFYSLLRKNFLNLISGLREFYTELLGCTEWKGKPFESECLKKTNWSCPTCESVTNFMCGLGGQIGTGFMLGGMLGLAKGLSNITQMKKMISLNPTRFGVDPSAALQISSRLNVNGAMNSLRNRTQTLRYRANVYARPVTTVLSSLGEEMKTLSGLGKNFKRFVSLNPVTLPYHLAYQYSKRAGFTRMSNQGIARLGRSNAVMLGQRYSIHLSNISERFANRAKDLYRIRGDRFNQSICDDIVTRHLDDVATESARMGIKVERVPGQQVLRMEKGGEIFEYAPNFKRRIDQASSFSQDDFVRHMSLNDPFLFDPKTMTTRPRMPAFLKEIHDKSHAVRDIVTMSSDNFDGLVYLGHFSAQVGQANRVEDCRDFLHDADYLEMHNITE